MRARKSRDSEREPLALPTAGAKRQAAGAAGPLGMQPTIGNAAVVRLLRRAGHSRAPAPATQRHTTQRSTVPGVLGGGGRALDPTTRTDMDGRLGTGRSARGGDGSTVQRMKRSRQDSPGGENPKGEISKDAVNLIAAPAGREDTYAGGRGRKIPKTPEQAACWEWAVRAAADSGGLDRGEYWSYLIGLNDEGDVRELDQVEPAVRLALDRLRDDITAAGMRFDYQSQAQHDENAIRPLMERAVRTFVRSHGLRIDAENPAGWIMCHYTMDGAFGAPEHFWIELPVPRGGRVVLQTVPDIPYIEAGGTDLRWHNENSVAERREGHATYQTIEVPVAALKGRYSEIINGILARGRRTRRKQAESSSGT